ncbi:MAG TPA: hypothetical protein VE130_12095 [Nitrososphaeraceae archaeon]|nr:hypothetical protein [Nitrososphaeraceae archaeon]
MRAFEMLFALVVLSSISLIDNDPNLTFEVLGQPDVETNLRPSDPVESLEAIGSPSNLMDSVLDEVRSTDTSKMSIKEDEEYSYSTGENILLSHQIVPAKDFIHLYDTHPFAIAEGSISTKLPCDSDNSTQLRIMIGKIPKLYPVNLSMEKELSKPGYMCLYNFEIQQNSTSNRNTLPITDIVLFNGSSERTVLPNTSNFVIGVTKLYPLQNTTILGP